jgi:hypothetical protein
MIKTFYNNKNLLFSSADFEGVEHLVCFRTLPFSFQLIEAKGAFVRDVRLFSNSEISREGSKDLIIAMRDFAINNNEYWTYEQMQEIEGTQTLFIVYNSQKDCFLNYSEDIITLEEVQNLYPDAEKVLVSQNVSDEGLILIVNELIEWL